HQKASDPALFFSDGTEYEVRTLLGHKFKLGLRSLQKSLAILPTAADGDFRLINVVPGTKLIKIRIEQYADTLLLVFFENIVKHKIDTLYRSHQHQRSNRNDGNSLAFLLAKQQQRKPYASDDRKENVFILNKEG